MNLLITAATIDEIQGIDRRLGSLSEEQLNIEIVVTGVGLMHSAFNLAKTISGNKYDLVLNIGIAGSFKPGIEIGTVVNVIEERVGDLGAEDGENFVDVIELGLLGKDEEPYQGGKLLNETSLHAELLDHLPLVRSISVNKVHGHLPNIEQVIQKYDPDIENMEGAATFYACLKERIPFYEFRAISNYVEQRNRDNWDVDLAVRNLENFVVEFVSELIVN